LRLNFKLIIMKSTKLAQSNSLTNARYEFSVIQKRFLYIIIREVRKLYIETNTGNRNLWSNLTIRMSPEELKEAGNATLVFSEANKLFDKRVYLNNDDEEGYVNFINYVIREKKTGMYEVEVSKKILPELVQLSEQFTTYEATVAISLKSFYSQRFYELCSQFKNYQNGYFFKDLEELKTLFNTPESYNNFGLFKAYVLEPAKLELKELYDKNESDLYFEYSEKEKKGKKVLSLAFRIVTRERENAKKYSPEDAIFILKGKLNSIFKNDKKYIDRIIKAMQLNPDICEPIMIKIHEKMNKYSRAEIAPIIRYILNEDFNIK